MQYFFNIDGTESGQPIGPHLFKYSWSGPHIDRSAQTLAVDKTSYLLAAFPSRLVGASSSGET